MKQGAYRTQVTPVIALTIGCALWGTADAVSKAALTSMTPVMLTMMRFAVAALVLWPFARRGPWVRIPVREAVPLALFGVTAMFLLQNLGLNRTAASNASLMQGATPAVTTIVAAMLVRQKIGWMRGVAIVVAIAGVVVITARPEGESSPVGSGEMLILLSMISFAIFTIRGQRAVTVYGALPVMFAISMIGSLSMVPIAIAEVAGGDRPGIDVWSGARVLYLGIGCSAIGFLLWGYALRHLDVCCVAAFDAVIPLVGCIAAAVFLGDRLGVQHLIGGAAILTALGITTANSRTQAGPESPAAPMETIALAV